MVGPASTHNNLREILSTVDDRRGGRRCDRPGTPEDLSGDRYHRCGRCGVGIRWLDAETVAQEEERRLETEAEEVGSPPKGLPSLTRHWRFLAAKTAMERHSLESRRMNES